MSVLIEVISWLFYGIEMNWTKNEFTLNLNIKQKIEVKITVFFFLNKLRMVIIKNGIHSHKNYYTLPEGVTLDYDSSGLKNQFCVNY